MDYSTPSENFFDSMLEQLQKTTAAIPQTQQRMMDIVGTGWSDDRMVKVVVGPRGQLVDLEIDPRVFRKPDAAELRAKILKASRDAVRQSTEQAQDIVNENFPPELEELRALAGDGGLENGDPLADAFRSDADVYAERQEKKK
ncbi:YbaB/EbfC family nucleoid-associated protein [Allokutzneria sp. A3M-2-11 16]|uniref:YbaB/EbfC family nucleoid-associated protein n=1 Tax=Allokutzneria sp. A3M-2-11 16 TaxID=2962043 RepID=UPI0020B77F9D|nr:YbaB/EbfC family nucleoid-associated protein [Allokutzneria sp. A3M-2-11 16]MCP3802597.1 YbaB/EbfC family nucleoid-associated protein [Allokutzneria sp. A3M-2-11 16]